MSTLYQKYRSELAGAYVLGVLLQPVRRRLERLVEQDAELLAELRFWEEQFAQLALKQIVPVEPPAHVHGEIRQRIAPARAQVEKKDSRAEKSRDKSSRWAWLFPSAAALVAGFLLAVFLRPEQIPEPQPLLPARVALISAESGEQLWLIGIQSDGTRMEVRNLEAVTAPSGKDYELWALPKDDASPVSLGLLPASAVTERELDDRQRAALGEAKALAISEEPTGGSTTGTPTGPVVYSAPLAGGQLNSSS